MKAAFFALVVAALVAVASAGMVFTDTVSANGLKFVSNTNVTVDPGDNRFQYRHTTLASYLYFAFYSSVEVDAEATGSNSAHATADAIVGAAAIPNILNPHPPSAYMAYFHAEADANVNDHVLSISGTASGSGVAIVFAKLEEVTSSGSSVQTTNLADVSFGTGSVQKDSTGNLQYITWSASTSSQDITITAAVSSVTGILNVGGAPITPKSMETFLEINQKTYHATTNHIRLTAYTASASATASFAASSNTFMSGAGPSQVFLHFNGEAVIDGSSKSVTVSGVAEGDGHTIDDLGNSIVQGILTANASLSVEVRKVVVDFPAGATHISYDPATGFDAPKSYSAAGSLSVPAVLVFAMAFAALLL